MNHDPENNTLEALLRSHEDQSPPETLHAGIMTTLAAEWEREDRQRRGRRWSVLVGCAAVAASIMLALSLHSPTPAPPQAVPSLPLGAIHLAETLPPLEFPPVYAETLRSASRSVAAPLKSAVVPTLSFPSLRIPSGFSPDSPASPGQSSENI